MNARSFVARHWQTAAGAGLGAAAGAAYAFFIGCHTGTCPLTSNVGTAALFFGFAGGVVGIPGPRREQRDRGREAGADGAGPA